MRLRIFALAVVLATLSPWADGQSTAGGLRGVTRDFNGNPLARALVTVHSVDGNIDRTVVSGGDGAFVVENLQPGLYELSARQAITGDEADQANQAGKASKEGFVSAPVTTLELAPGQSIHRDLALVAQNDSQKASAPPTSAAPAETWVENTPSTAQGNFFKRLAKAYTDDWFGTPVSGPAPPHRGFPSPESAPPYPFSDWPYGGSIDIGAAYTSVPPLMTALTAGSHGKFWKDSRVQIYGWFNNGFNVSSSAKPGYANLPTAYDEKPNSIQPDQEVLYIERQPDAVQTDHFDWGFRLGSLYGIDYRFTTAKGVFSQQLLGRVNPDGSVGKEYGYDLVMAYVDLYWGQVAQGMNIRIGRYISLPDIEAQLAPNNYTYSHSLLYTYDCYTQTGINGTVKLNNHWLFQAGISGGCEAVPFITHHDAKPTFNTCVQYTWNEGNDSVYPCLNALNDGKYAYNNLNSVYDTWYHKFKTHPSWHIATEWWYMWERDTPNVQNPAAASLLERNANGAVCDKATALTCFAPEWAILNYAEKQFSPKDYFTIRNEYFDDMVGQRTGFKSKYTEHELAWGHWVGTTVLFRPELRFERSYDVPAYDNGTKKNQLTLAGDVIFFF